ncbi:MAG: aldo/keto reductase [Armatimonadetes bacterium]|nr:MAG: aldo/keto reductase [Armatimonadota bacterium]GIV01307.1 MAG: voltage-gated potassium channel [Fimbriimonadales bacterium]
MQYRPVGRSGLKVSAIGLGGWLTHGRTVGAEELARLVRVALDHGVIFFDTADIYAKGEAEKALGHAIKGLRRQDLVLATKCFWPMTENPNDRGLSRKHVFESVHASLQRLQVDYVDLFQFHRYDPETPVEESVRAVDDLIRQGKILYWGVSEWTAAQIRDACHIARAIGAPPPISDQPLYNMIDRKIEEEILPVCASEGMGILAFSPLAQGVLTGKYRPGSPPPEGSRATDEVGGQFMQRYLDERILKAVVEIERLAGEAACTLAQFALAWCLRKPEVSSVIVGARTEEQLLENLKAVDTQIDPGLFARAVEALG